MRWTKTLIPTLKEVPSDAELKSHRLMIRAGMIKKLSPGVYVQLPLGWRVLHKVEEIVRQEMDRAGAIEIHMPVLQPIELWEESGRATHYGPELMKITDRHDKLNALGPTHEEVVTDVARSFVSSYKQLPLTLYQIQVKFRDEIRPRFGVMRAREFVMKDAYSFDVDVPGLEKSYQAQYDAYCRIFNRCGFQYVVVEAESGPIGGSASSEFMVPSDAGEDQIVSCPACGYAANMEKATCQPLPAAAKPAKHDEMKVVATPNQKTIDEVAAFLKVRPCDLIKTLIYVTEDGAPLIACVRGDHDVNEFKLAAAAGGPVALAGESVIEAVSGAPVGFAGPACLPAGSKTPIYVDRDVATMVNAVTGANQADAHRTGVNPGRDFPLARVHDLRFVMPGNLCPRCNVALTLSRGIEVGHVFKLGTKYSDALKATYLDAAGQSQPMIMGCYGIGVSRVVAAAIEVLGDDAGLIWPMSMAPYHVLLVPIRVEGEEMEAAEKLYAELTAQGLEVLLDDRDARAGVKFNDADLIGVPLRVNIGARGLKEGIVEVRDRASGETVKVPVGEAVAHLKAEVRKRLAALEK
jgi:prolyl-tRNA synthetase